MQALKSRQSPTVATLLAIRPGQKFVYYRGDLKADILRCSAKGKAGKGSPLDPGAPKYGGLLTEIMNTALQLQTEGKVKLQEVKITSEKTGRGGRIPPVFEYIAIGL